MEKRLEDLSDNELKAIKAIINGYPMTSEMMKIKKDLNNESGSIYKNVYFLLKNENDKKKALEKFKKEEMKRYRSFDERKINILHKSLSLKRKIPNLQKLNKSVKSIKNNPTKPTSINYINDDKYKLYDDNYKKVISARSKSLTVSKSINSAINLEEEDIIDNLKSYMDKYFYPGNIIRYLSMLLLR
jgi:isochorismate synthase EntC